MDPVERMMNPEEPADLQNPPASLDRYPTASPSLEEPCSPTEGEEVLIMADDLGGQNNLGSPFHFDSYFNLLGYQQSPMTQASHEDQTTVLGESSTTPEDPTSKSYDELYAEYYRHRLGPFSYNVEKKPFEDITIATMFPALVLQGTFPQSTRYSSMDGNSVAESLLISRIWVLTAQLGEKIWIGSGVYSLCDVYVNKSKCQVELCLGSGGYFSMEAIQFQRFVSIYPGYYLPGLWIDT